MNHCRIVMQNLCRDLYIIVPSKGQHVRPLHEGVLLVDDDLVVLAVNISPSSLRTPANSPIQLLSLFDESLHHSPLLLNTGPTIELNSLDRWHRIDDLRHESATESFVISFRATETLEDTVTGVALHINLQLANAYALAETKRIVDEPSTWGRTPSWTETQLERCDALALALLQACEQWPFALEVLSRMCRKEAEGPGAVEQMRGFVVDLFVHSHETQFPVVTLVVIGTQVYRILGIVVVEEMLVNLDPDF